MPCNLTELLSEPQSRDVVLAQAIGTPWESGPQPRGQRGQWLSVGFNIERNTASELGDAPKATRGGFTREESACPSLHVTPLSLKTHLLTGIRLVPESTGLAALGVTTVYRGQTLLGWGRGASPPEAPFAPCGARNLGSHSPLPCFMPLTRLLSKRVPHTPGRLQAGAPASGSRSSDSRFQNQDKWLRKAVHDSVRTEAAGQKRRRSWRGRRRQPLGVLLHAHRPRST